MCRKCKKYGHPTDNCLWNNPKSCAKCNNPYIGKNCRKCFGYTDINDIRKNPIVRQNRIQNDDAISSPKNTSVRSSPNSSNSSPILSSGSSPNSPFKPTRKITLEDYFGEVNNTQLETRKTLQKEITQSLSITLIQDNLSSDSIIENIRDFFRVHVSKNTKITKRFIAQLIENIYQNVLPIEEIFTYILSNDIFDNFKNEPNKTKVSNHVCVLIKYNVSFALADIYFACTSCVHDFTSDKLMEDCTRERKEIIMEFKKNPKIFIQNLLKIDLDENMIDDISKRLYYIKSLFTFELKPYGNTSKKIKTIHDSFKKHFDIAFFRKDVKTVVEWIMDRTANVSNDNEDICITNSTGAKMIIDTCVFLHLHEVFMEGSNMLKLLKFRIMNENEANSGYTLSTCFSSCNCFAVENNVRDLEKIKNDILIHSELIDEKPRDLIMFEMLSGLKLKFKENQRMLYDKFIPITHEECINVLMMYDAKIDLERTPQTYTELTTAENQENKKHIAKCTRINENLTEHHYEKYENIVQETMDEIGQKLLPTDSQILWKNKFNGSIKQKFNVDLNIIIHTHGKKMLEEFKGCTYDLSGCFTQKEIDSIVWKVEDTDVTVDAQMEKIEQCIDKIKTCVLTILKIRPTLKPMVLNEFYTWYKSKVSTNNYKIWLSIWFAYMCPEMIDFTIELRKQQLSAELNEKKKGKMTIVRNNFKQGVKNNVNELEIMLANTSVIHPFEVEIITERITKNEDLSQYQKNLIIQMYGENTEYSLSKQEKLEFYEPYIKYIVMGIQNQIVPVSEYFRIDPVQCKKFIEHLRQNVDYPLLGGYKRFVKTIVHDDENVRERYPFSRELKVLSPNNGIAKTLLECIIASTNPKIIYNELMAIHFSIRGVTKDEYDFGIYTFEEMHGFCFEHARGDEYCAEIFKTYSAEYSKAKQDATQISKQDDTRIININHFVELISNSKSKSRSEIKKKFVERLENFVLKILKQSFIENEKNPMNMIDFDGALYYINTIIANISDVSTQIEWEETFTIIKNHLKKKMLNAPTNIVVELKAKLGFN